MDLAYDHITEETLKNEAKQAANDKGKQPEDPNTLTADVQDAYRAFSASPWGARIGGFIGAVAKQVRTTFPQPPRSRGGGCLISLRMASSITLSLTQSL